MSASGNKKDEIYSEEKESFKYKLSKPNIVENQEFYQRNVYGLEHKKLLMNNLKYKKEFDEDYERKRNEIIMRSKRNFKNEQKYSRNYDKYDPNNPNFVELLGRWSGLYGCEKYYSGSKQECWDGGGVWYDGIWSKDECLSIRGCREPKSHYCAYKIDGSQGSIDFVTNKTVEECEKCGGYFVILIFHNLLFYFILFSILNLFYFHS